MEIPKYIEAFRKDMQFKRFRQNTIDNYASCVTAFLYSFDKKITEPKKINAFILDPGNQQQLLKSA